MKPDDEVHSYGHVMFVGTWPMAIAMVELHVI